MSLGSPLGGPRVKPNAWKPEPPKQFKHITVAKVTPAIGAEVTGVDLANPSLEQIEELKLALDQHLVLFFRDQTMSPEQHLALGRHWGDLDIHPAAPNAGPPELMVIATDETSTRANGEGWHSDVSCQIEPPMGSILHIRECPPEGGDTLFASMEAAYEALSDRMKTYLDGLEAEHDGGHVYKGLYANLGVADKPVYPRAKHPVVRIHPRTGRKSLYVNRGFTTRILGIPADESSAVLNYLYQHCENPLFQCRFRWQAGSVAFWENRTTIHRAMCG